MNPRELATQLAALTVLEDAVKEQRQLLRQQLTQAFDEVGADSAKLELPDGTKVGKATLISPKQRPMVVDEHKFTKWVEENHPSEIEKKVNKVFESALLEKLDTNGTAACHPETGEVIPGVLVMTSSKYVSTRFDAGGKQAVIDAIRTGEMAIQLPTQNLALPVGGDA